MNDYGITVYTVVVDGKIMTVVDPDNDSHEDFVSGIHKRFGKDRVNKIERKLTHDLLNKLK